MKLSIPVCILAGGLGTRLSEETTLKPKPMVEIGGKPILWHIMKTYEHYGFQHFKIALGYRPEVIKNYFLNYRTLQSDLSIDLSSGAVQASNTRAEAWKVDLLDTGLETMTGGRVRQLCEAIGSGIFMLTYGDGVADVNIAQLVNFHMSHGKLATVTAVRPPARFGAMSLDGDAVSSFQEKPQIGEGWINGGFFVLDTRIASYLDDDAMPFEQLPLAEIAADGELMAYRHNGYWQCMDTIRDVKTLEGLWQSGKAPWRVWDNSRKETSNESKECQVHVLE